MRTIHRWAVVALGLPLVACEAGPTTPEPADAPGPFVVTAYFNPQPEPPPAVFKLSMEGRLEGDWRGMLGVRGGEATAENLTSEMNGETLHLSQEWTFVLPEPVFPPEPVRLMGIVNRTTGELVLNGTTEEGVPVHVRGQVTETGGGLFSIGGEVMFNPQPEPPPEG